MAHRFTGFPLEAIEFFEDLEMNNNRDWYQANKQVYERACRGPMEALLAELEPKYGAGRIFRINRDTRFAADKSPYKTNIAAPFGARNYISLSQEGLFVGSGGYMLDGDALARYRDAIVDDKSGRELEKIVTVAEENGYELASHAPLKTAPKGYPRDHPRVRFLRHKGMFMGRTHPPGAWLATRKAFDKVTTVLGDTKPLNRWYDRHVDAS